MLEKASKMVQKEVCKWFDACPLKIFFKQGKIDSRWVEDYCWQNNPRCMRKKLEEEGVYHPDNMLPDGTIDHNLH